MTSGDQLSRRELLVGGLLTSICGGSIFLAEETIRGTCALDNSSYRYFEHPVEQVFRDHDGIRTFFRDTDGRVIEWKYRDFGYIRPNPPQELASKFKNLDRPIAIYDDLRPDEFGYAKVLLYNAAGLFGGQKTTIEIHRPRDSIISPGNETYGGKVKTNTPMGEIK